MKLYSKVRNFFSRLNESKLKKRKTKRLLGDIQRRPEGRNSYYSYLKFGKKFIESFDVINLSSKRNYRIDLTTSSWEAPLAVTIYSSQKRDDPHGPLGQRDFEIKIGFAKNIVHIKAIQGTKGKIKSIKQLEGIVGMPVPNYLLTIIEEHAKRQGYKKVIMDLPESLIYFKNPSLGTGILKNNEYYKEKESIQKRMIMMYRSLASSMGYKHVGERFEKSLVS